MKFNLNRTIIPKISIILLNYNGLQFNKDCINSLLQQTYTDFEIIFVNNYATDGSDEEVKNIFHNQIQQGILKFVQAPYNLGFAGGNNYGVLHSDPDSDYICLLNNDIVAPTDWLQNLINGMQSDQKLGAVGSVIYDKGFESKMDDFLFTKHLKGINNYFFDSTIVPQTQEDKQGNIIYTTGISGCCLMYKKKLLKEPFEDMYFAYMEDTALSIKIILQGYRVGIVKNSTIQHFGSGSFGKKPNLFKVFHGLKNYILNFVLLSQGYKWIIVLPRFVAGLLVRTLFDHQIIRIRGLIKVLWRIFTHIPQIYKERKKIKVVIKPQQLYAQLGTNFIELPFYAENTGLKNTIVKIINRISQAYFRLFGI